jgi:hypothetical protein
VTRKTAGIERMPIQSIQDHTPDMQLRQHYTLACCTDGDKRIHGWLHEYFQGDAMVVEQQARTRQLVLLPIDPPSYLLNTLSEHPLDTR